MANATPGVPRLLSVRRAFCTALTGLSAQLSEGPGSAAASESSEAALFAQLSDEIGRLSRITVSCKSRINACSPLLRLPHDVLCSIASHLVTIWPPNLYSGTQSARASYGKKTIGWAILGHVCHDLRETLLEYHYVWAEDVFAFLGAEAEIIRRAGSSPLVFIIPRDECERAASQIRLMVQHISKAKAINIDHSHGLMAERRTATDKWSLDPKMLSGREFPYLEELSLALSPDSPHFGPVTKGMLDLPPMRARVLRYVNLKNSYLPFAANNLTYLSLDNSSSLIPRPSSSHFQNMLRSCSSKLQTLILSCWTPSPFSPSLGSIISFSSLRYVYIDDSTVNVSAFLSHVSIPPEAARSVRVRGVPEEWARTGQHLNLLRDHLRREFAPEVEAINVELSSIHTLKMSFFAPRVTASQSQTTPFFPRQDPILLLTTHTKAEQSLSLPQATRFAAELFDPSQVQDLGIIDLDMYDTPRYPARIWLAALQSLSNVRTLYLGNLQEDREMYMALTKTVNLSNTLLLPSLKNLWLSPPDFSEDMNPLISSVRARKRMGFSIGRLRIDEFEMEVRGQDEDIVDRVLPLLRTVVPHVECWLDNTIVEGG